MRSLQTGGTPNMRIQTMVLPLLAAAAAMSLWMAVGCGSSQPAAENAAASQNGPGAQGDTQLAAFRAEDGMLQCPVMGTKISSVQNAFDYSDHGGKRYYFCCDGCKPEFDKEPGKFEDGKALKSSKPSESHEHKEGDGHDHGSS
jgi:YHS domain-containing protein